MREQSGNADGPASKSPELTPAEAARRRRLAALALGAALVTAAAASIVFQDNIARLGLNPRSPFQTAPAPQPPEYGARGAWALWPDKDLDDASAEVFYVHSTTYYSARSWNAPIAEPKAEAILRRNAIPNEAGPFSGIGPIYAPRYRQATLFSFFTHKYDGVAAREFAYRDVRAAFIAYLAQADPAKPLILVGYGQGGLHVQRLLEEFFQTDKKLRGRLAVAYLLEQATPLDLFDGVLKETPPCRAPEETRCVISYIDYEPGFGGEMERARNRSMSWTADGRLKATVGRPLLCVNPLTWREGGGRADAESHDGAASATGLKFGETPPALAKAIGAECVDGVLVVDRPVQAFLRRPSWFGQKWRARSYNLFYFDLAADATRRVALTSSQMAEEARILEPIAESVELEDSPINMVPRQ